MKLLITLLALSGLNAHGLATAADDPARFGNPTAGIVKDVVLVQAPTEVMVAGVASGHARIHYTMELADGRSFPTASELWIVPRGDYFFMIGAGTRQDEKTGTRAEIQGILNSIQFTR